MLAAKEGKLSTWTVKRPFRTSVSKRAQGRRLKVGSGDHIFGGSATSRQLAQHARCHPWKTVSRKGEKCSKFHTDTLDCK